MNAQKNIVGKHPRPLNAARAARVPSYLVTLTDTGKWLHAPGSDFLFAYLEDNWPATVTADVTAAFETALAMSTAIKQSVKNTSGEDVVSGLYLLNQTAMVQAMSAIGGMGQTDADQRSESGSGTAASINGEFFTAVLGGLGGDVAPLLTYLTTQMGDVQAQTKKSTVTECFGTVIGLISVMPVLNVPITTFQYVYSDSQTSEWFVKINCGSAQSYSYDYNYTVVDFNYEKPTSNT